MQRFKQLKGDSWMTKISKIDLKRLDIFLAPDGFDISGPNIHKHVVFGYGSHQCLGSHRTRINLRVVLESILKQFDGISCPADDKLEFNAYS